MNFSIFSFVFNLIRFIKTKKIQRLAITELNCRKLSFYLLFKGHLVCTLQLLLLIMFNDLIDFHERKLKANFFSRELQILFVIAIFVSSMGLKIEIHFSTIENRY